MESRGGRHHEEVAVARPSGLLEDSGKSCAEAFGLRCWLEDCRESVEPCHPGQGCAPLDRILDDTFVNVTSEGRFLTKAKVLAEVKVSSNQFVTTSESMIVRLHGDTAVATGIRKTTGLVRGRPFARQERFLDTWLYKNGSWVSLASLATPIA
jgi:hypothetical protein